MFDWHNPFIPKICNNCLTLATYYGGIWDGILQCNGIGVLFLLEHNYPAAIPLLSCKIES